MLPSSLRDGARDTAQHSALLQVRGLCHGSEKLSDAATLYLCSGAPPRPDHAIHVGTPTGCGSIHDTGNGVPGLHSAMADQREKHSAPGAVAVATVGARWAHVTTRKLPAPECLRESLKTAINQATHCINDGFVLCVTPGERLDLVGRVPHAGAPW